MCRDSILRERSLILTTTDYCEILKRSARNNGLSYARVAFPILVDLASSNGLDSDAEKIAVVKDLCLAYFEIQENTSIPWEVIPNPMESTSRDLTGNLTRSIAHTASVSARTCTSTQTHDTENPACTR